MNIPYLYKTYCKIRSELIYLLGKSTPELIPQEKLRNAVDGSIKFADAYAIGRILNEQRPKKILEIGSFLGFSTRWLCEMSSLWRARITAIDPNIKHRIFSNPQAILMEFNKKFIEKQTLHVVTAFFGKPFVDKDIKWRYKNEVNNDQQHVDNLIKNIQVVDKNYNDKFDFIFIDGAHHFDAVSDNFNIAKELLNKNGIIAFHDVLTWEDVNRFVHNLKHKDKDGQTEIINAGSVFEHPDLSKEPVKTVDGIGIYKMEKRSQFIQ